MALKHANLTFSPTTRPTAVIGSGTLGSRIALMLASSGGEVRLYDPNADQLENARRYVEAELPRVGAGGAGGPSRALVLSRAGQSAAAGTWIGGDTIPHRAGSHAKTVCETEGLS